MKRTTRFRQLVEAPEILCLPGVQDALTARVAERAGFDAMTCGGYSATACLLGRPDTSVLSLTELADHYRRICDAVEVPVFGDGDTGFGNITNAVRTVRMLEAAGLAGTFLEDQVFPKRCGHMTGKAVVPVEEMVAKLKAALDARRDPDFVLVARTDAIAVEGLDAAIERANIYRETGVDMIFVEAPESVEAMRRICREIPAPCLANNIEGGRTPLLSGAELQEIGYAAYAHPVAISHAIAHLAFELFTALRRDGTTAALADRMTGFSEFHALLGLPEQRRAEERYQDFAQDLLARHGRTSR